MGTPNVGTRDPLKVLESALRGGITTFQLREKGENALQGEPLKEFAKRCQQLCQQYQVPFIVNDDVQLAVEINADGVHIGQQDGVIQDVRERMGPEKIVGVSVNTVDEALEAADANVDYIGVGPIYDTKTKTDTDPVVGPERIQEIIQPLPGLPIVGIGGISERKAKEVIHAGATGVAVISAIANADDVEAAARQFKGEILLAVTGVEM